MNVLAEIREAFANLQDGSTAYLKSGSAQWPSFVFRDGSTYGVAIEVPVGLAVSERFAGARFRAASSHVPGVTRLLRLESRRANLRNEFAVLCTQFVDSGEGGEAREALLREPLKWWERWRDLLGNAVRIRPAYSVLGELLAFERLVISGMSPEWSGPVEGAQDLCAAGSLFEVKSTVSRYGTTVRIAGQFQLKSGKGTPLFLVHQRFEPGGHGDCVEDVVTRLVDRGADRDVLEGLLEREGLESGAAARRERYKLLESRKYPVDASFPRITPESFVGGLVPKGVVSIGYEVDLAGLECEEF